MGTAPRPPDLRCGRGPSDAVRARPAEPGRVAGRDASPPRSRAAAFGHSAKPPTLRSSPSAREPGPRLDSDARAPGPPPRAGVWADPPRPPQAAVQPYGVLSETQKRPPGRTRASACGPSGLACGSTGARAPVEVFTPKTQQMADGTRTSAGFSDAPTGKSRHRLGKSLFMYLLVPHALANRRWLVRVTHRQAASDGSKISFGLKRRAGLADVAQPGHEARRTRSCRVRNGDGPSAARSHRGNVCLRFVHRFRNTW